MNAWLLTWLWQGSALAATVGLALRFGPRQNAATRHAIWCAALAAVTWLGWASSPAEALGPATVQVAETIYIPSAPDFLAIMLASIWAAITLVSLLRVVPGLHAVFTIRDRCRAFPLALEAQLPLWLAARQDGRSAQLMICNEVPGATVLGFYRPCIAIPPSLVGALTIDELDQVILHEYAHVQRRDDWSQLAQRLLVSVLWVHPAALLVSRALSREREMACDEWVVSRTGQPKAYARCLAHAAELRALGSDGAALQPTLIGRRHELIHRVDRVLAMPRGGARGVSLTAAAAAVCAMAVLSVPLQVVRFAEMAEIMFPLEQVQQMDLVRWVAAVPMFPGDILPTARITPHVTQKTDAPTAPTAPVAPIAPDALIALIAPVAPDAPSLTARAFPGLYASAAVAVRPAADPQNRWKAVAAPAVEMVTSAKKTSIRVANGFSRAGASLAQRF